MPLWDLENPPKFLEKTSKKSVATDRGWENSQSKQKEVIVAVSSLARRAQEANILSVSFGAASYVQGDPISVIVRYNERVHIASGSSLVITSTGISGDITVYATEQMDVAEAVFDLDVSGLAPALVPLEAAQLSIDAQSIVGLVVDANDRVTASELTISAPVAAAAGVRDVE